MGAEPPLLSGASEHSRNRIAAARRSTVVGVFGRVSGIACSTLTTALATRYLGAAAFGLLATVTSILVLFSFTDQGIGSGVVNSIAAARATGDDLRVREIVTASLFLLCGIASALGVLFTGLTLGLPWHAWLRAPSNISPAELSLSLLLLMAIFCLGVAFGLGDRLRAGMQQGWIASGWNAGGGLLAVALLIIAIRAKASFAIVVALMTCGALVGQVLNLTHFFRSYAEFRPKTSDLRGHVVRDLLRQGGPIALLNVLSALAFFTDTIIVARALGPAVAAEYAIPAKLATVTLSVLAFLTLPLWPAYVDAVHRDDWHQVQTMYRSSVRRTTVIAGIAALGLLISGPALQRLWVGNAVQVSWPVIAGESVWVLLSALGSVVTVFLVSQGLLRIQIYLYAAMSVVNVAASIAVVRLIGPSGPIIVTDVTFGVMTLTPLLVVCRGVIARRPVEPGRTGLTAVSG